HPSQWRWRRRMAELLKDRPTAQGSAGASAETDQRRVPSGYEPPMPGLGLATIDQPAPFQCSISDRGRAARWVCPTAQTFDPEVPDRDEIPLCSEEGDGDDTIRHVRPSQ